jgi:hypothetical protein
MTATSDRLTMMKDPREEPFEAAAVNISSASFSSSSSYQQLQHQLLLSWNESSSLLTSCSSSSLSSSTSVSLFSLSSNFSSFLSSRDLEKSLFHFSSLYSFFHPSHLIRTAFWMNVLIMIFILLKKAGNDATAAGNIPWWNLDFLKKSIHEFIERRVMTPARK